MSVTLYRKYRPQHFSDVIGQATVVRTLENALKLGRVGQAYLLTGPRGTGKTTLARLFAKAVNCADRKGAEPCDACEHCHSTEEGRSLDVIEIDAASHTGVDHIRDLRDTVKLLPTSGSHKIYIIDEVHMLSTGAFNALLKTLEEPPAHVIFILATTEIHKVPETILSRCQRFDLARLPIKNIEAKLARIAKAEGITITKGALHMLAELAEGAMRDAESALTQIASLSENAIDEETVASLFGSSQTESLITLAGYLVHRDLFAALTFVGTLSENGRDLTVFSGSFLNFLRKLLLASAAPKEAAPFFEDLAETEREAIMALSAKQTPRDIVRLLELFQVAKRDAKNTPIPELPLEIAIVKALSLDQETPSIIHAAPRTQPTPPTPLPSSSATPAGTVAHTKTPAPEPVPANIPRPLPVASTLPAPSKVTPSEVPPAPIPAAFSLHEITAAWTSILEQAKILNASLALALVQVRPIAVEGRTLILQTKHNFHKERLENPESKLTLSKAFAKILSFEPNFKIILETTVAATPARPALAPNDSLVSQAVEMLGGTLVSEQS